VRSAVFEREAHARVAGGEALLPRAIIRPRTFATTAGCGIDAVRVILDELAPAAPRQELAVLREIPDGRRLRDDDLYRRARAGQVGYLEIVDAARVFEGVLAVADAAAGTVSRLCDVRDGHSRRIRLPDS